MGRNISKINQKRFSKDKRIEKGAEQGIRCRQNNEVRVIKKKNKNRHRN